MENMRMSVLSLNSGEEIWTPVAQLSAVMDRMIAKDVDFAIKNRSPVVKFENTWTKTPWQEVPRKLGIFYKLKSFENDIATFVLLTAEELLLRQEALESFVEQDDPYIHPLQLIFPARFSAVDFESFLSDDYERVADQRTPHPLHEADDIVFMRKNRLETAEAPMMDE